MKVNLCCVWYLSAILSVRYLFYKRRFMHYNINTWCWRLVFADGKKRFYTFFTVLFLRTLYTDHIICILGHVSLCIWRLLRSESVCLRVSYTKTYYLYFRRYFIRHLTNSEAVWISRFSWDKMTDASDVSMWHFG